jgi:predicted SprT family Zn-dependent metalloprotease
VRLSFDDIWTPDRPLPDGPGLRSLCGRLLAWWNASDLLPRLTVAYNPAMRTALGRAKLRQWRVELNVRLLMRAPAELIPTLAHELAHFVVFRRVGSIRQPHGPEFMELMRLVGMPQRARHRVNVSGLRRRRQHYLYRQQCRECGASFIVRRVRRRACCPTCGKTPAWAVHRAPATPEGLALLQAAPQADDRG